MSSFPQIIEFGICCHTYIALRREPSEASEMVSQVLFGEHYLVNEVVGDWLHITNHADSYSGYINKKLHKQILESHFNMLSSGLHQVVQVPLDSILRLSDNLPQPLVGASILPFITDEGIVSLGPDEFKYKAVKAIESAAVVIMKLAKSYLGAPYLWGGKTLLGIDCSGLTQVCYRAAGLQIERDASQQVNRGTTLSFINEAHAADLAFFDNPEGKIIHVGLLTGKGTIIHASGMVREDKIDHQGIFNSETQTYTHKLRIIKRII